MRLYAYLANYLLFVGVFIYLLIDYEFGHVNEKLILILVPVTNKLRNL